MKKEEFSEVFGDINENYVKEAETIKKTRKPAWLKWGAMAACLCLVVSIAIPVLHHKVGPGSEDPVHDIAALEYNGKFYEAVNIPEVLEKYGLPSKITADMAGEHLEYLKSDGGVGYECTASQTDIELYQYAPSVCDGVYLLRDGETWYAALFCNFYQFDSNTSVELTELYRVYGIESANDIAAITEMDWNRSKEVGTPVVNQQEITEFYDMTVALWSYGNDDFQKQMFDGYPDEESQQKAHIAFADDYRCLRIETADGLRFFIGFYPSFDWIYGGGTMSYFKIDEQMHAWIDRNLNR
jgi:hypothetical protein